MTIWLTVISTQLHFIYIIIDRLIKGLTDQVSRYTILYLLLSLMKNTKLINVSIESIEDITAVNALDSIIINAIKTIKKNKKAIR